MATHITVPQLGESVLEARVAKWLKNEGDWVNVGEPVVELETDKIDLEVGAERGGVLTSIKRQSGEDVRLGDVLGVIEEKDPAAKPDIPAREEPGGDRVHARPAAGTAPAGGRAPSTQAVVEEPGVAPPENVRARATPTAKTVARAHTLDLSRIEGSGVAGRITKRDVESQLQEAAPPSEPTTPAVRTEPAAKEAPREEPTSGRREERIRMSKRRLTIAKNLVAAQHAAAMLTTFNEVDMSAVMALRARQKESFKKRYGISLGITSFFVKAAVGALKAFPRLNAEVDGDEMILKHYYDIGIAVGDSRGLVVPVIRDASERSFREIEAGIHDLASRAAAGTLTLDDLRGGTFTITNGGTFGSLLSTPILNPPQVGILGLHKIQDRPIATNGEVSIRPMMYVALTYDHRIVDGLEAVQFLVRVKELAEDPGELLLDS
jgi:2-oxoglutarate dehydrogenase E2 component (dihydrolipoamide succinyltransferase)